jgi:hypothetical protein
MQETFLFFLVSLSDVPIGLTNENIRRRLLGLQPVPRFLKSRFYRRNSGI